MKRIACLLLALSLIVSLSGCTLLKAQRPDRLPAADSNPTVPDTSPDLPTVPVIPPDAPGGPDTPPDTPDQPLPEPVFTFTDETQTLTTGSVTVTITRPVVELQSASAAEVVNHYYTLLSGKVRDYAEGDLTAIPGVTYTVTADYNVCYFSADALSVLWTVDTTTSSPELNGSTTVSAATFNPNTGALLTFSGIFGGNAQTVRGLLVEKAREVIAARQTEYYYYENWRELADSAFDTDRFYLTEQGVAVFYPREDLGSYTEALLPWDAAAKYLLAPL